MSKNRMPSLGPALMCPVLLSPAAREEIILILGLIALTPPHLAANEDLGRHQYHIFKQMLSQEAQLNTNSSRGQGRKEHLRDELGLQRTPPRGGQQQLRSPKHVVSKIRDQLRMPCYLPLHMAVVSASKQGSGRSPDVRTFGRTDHQYLAIPFRAPSTFTLALDTTEQISILGLKHFLIEK